VSHYFGRNPWNHESCTNKVREVEWWSRLEEVVGKGAQWKVETVWWRWRTGGASWRRRGGGGSGCGGVGGGGSVEDV